VTTDLALIDGLIPENNLYYQFGIRGPNYWKQYTTPSLPLAFGFGYGLWWTTQYPWARHYFPFMRWFPVLRWQPYYVVSAEDLVDYTYEAPLTDDAVLLDTDVFGQVALPQLPTFASIGISLDVLAKLSKPLNALRERDRQTIMLVVMQIQKSLDSLNANGLLLPYRQAGYVPVPDLDIQRFMWIKDASKRGTLQPLRVATHMFIK